MNFELLLTLVTISAGLICFWNRLFLAPKRRADQPVPKLVSYAQSFFPALLIVLLFRSFVIEPYRIPSGSDKPTLLVGDFIAANKFIYGLRLPIWHYKFVTISEPKRGDIILFRYPVDPSINFIKRVIGVPGDRIAYVNKILYINGIQVNQRTVGYSTDSDTDETSWPVEIREEKLNGLKHLIYVRPDTPSEDFSVTVPPHSYFVMGDNRDDSNDSRYWGFVPEQNLLGKAWVVWFSWEGYPNFVRWSRIGHMIR